MRIAKLILFSLTLLASESNAQGIACQDVSADADIVIMMDVTGSNVAANIAEQKAAVSNFISSFTSPAVTIKPFIGLGTFNADCKISSTGALVCVGDAARIVPGGSLTNDYGAVGGPLDLMDAVTNVTGSGLFGRGLGGTNLAAALQIAQQELATNGDPSRPDYIVLISDGNPNLPGFATNPLCTSCDCIEAEDAADAVTQLIELAPDAKVLAVHYKGVGVTCADEGGETAGASYMRSRIATAPALFYSGLVNIFDVFQEIAQDLTCQGVGGACVIDFCDTSQSTPICSSVPDTTDSDGDGTPDCIDLCPGADDSLIGGSCSVGTGMCQNFGVNICDIDVIKCSAALGTPTPEVCDGLDNDCDGAIDNSPIDPTVGSPCTVGTGQCSGTGLFVCDAGSVRCDAKPSPPALVEICDGLDNDCNGATDEGAVCCSSSDLSSTMFELDNNAGIQLALVKKTLRKLERAGEKQKRFIKKSLAEAQLLYSSSWSTSWSFPSSVTSCALPSADCVSSLSLSPQIETYKSNAGRFFEITAVALKKLQKARGKKKSDKKISINNRKLLEAAIAEISEVPAQSAVCN